MDQIQTANQIMLETVTGFLADKPEHRQANAALQGCYDYLCGICETIEDLGEAQERPLTGVTADKAIVRKELERAIVACNSHLCSHGTKSGNEILRHEFRGTPSDIVRLSDSDLRRAARRTIQAVTQYEALLPTYGYTPAHGEALRKNSKQFRALMRAPRKAITNRADLTAEIARTLDQAMDHLREQLDPLMQQYWGTDPVLYRAYRKARRRDARRPKSTPAAPSADADADADADTADANAADATADASSTPQDQATPSSAPAAKVDAV
jgi:hypothetical protein